MPPVSYWQRLRYSKNIQKAPKLPVYDGPEEVCLCYRDEQGNYIDPEDSLFIKRKNEIKVLFGKIYRSSGRLNKPDCLITEAKETLLKQKPSKYDRYPGILETSYGQINIQVTVKNLRRALRFMDMFIKLIKQLNYDINVMSGKTIIIIDGIEMDVRLRETYKIIKVDEPFCSQKIYSIWSAIL